MGRHPKGWFADQEENLDKQADKAEGKVKIIKHTTEVVEEVAAQDVAAGDKKKLPRVIIATWDKHGNLTHKVYICANIKAHEEVETDLSDGSPTKRKDYINLTLEAQVVGVE
jgi:hypothetical protein